MSSLDTSQLSLKIIFIQLSDTKNVILCWRSPVEPLQDVSVGEKKIALDRFKKACNISHLFIHLSGFKFLGHLSLFISF